MLFSVFDRVFGSGVGVVEVTKGNENIINIEVNLRESGFDTEIVLVSF